MAAAAPMAGAPGLAGHADASPAPAPPPGGEGEATAALAKISRCACRASRSCLLARMPSQDTHPTLEALSTNCPSRRVPPRPPSCPHPRH